MFEAIGASVANSVLSAATATKSAELTPDNAVISELNPATVVTLDDIPATVLTLAMLVATVFMLEALEATDVTLLAIPATVVTLPLIPDTVVISLAIAARASMFVVVEPNSNDVPLLSYFNTLLALFATVVS